MPEAAPSTAAAREARHFDRLVATTGDFDPFTDRAWATLALRFAAAAGTRAGASVLDVGCGTGHSRRVYAARTARYCGIDLSLVSLRLAQRRQPGEWLQADAGRLPFAADSFDVVAFSSVLHHLPDRGLALGEARRVLRPGGLVFAFDPNLLHPAMMLFRHPRSPLYRPEGVSPDEKPLLPAALRRDFRAAGFTAIGQRCTSDLPYRAVAPRGLNALLGLYNRVDWSWEKVGLGRYFGAFAITWATKAG
ncbi:MAG TPA: methyltransferase domain-containing protein [Thermoanaerobaculia bacterium]|nr:methyltransferase domain-containing protein [Thermoanaerobaculia bacterium]